MTTKTDDAPLFGELKTEKEKQSFLHSLIWFVLAILLAFPLASFLSPFWLFLQLIEPWVPVVRELNTFIEKFMTWPRLLGMAIYEGSADFPNPLEERTGDYTASN